VIYFEMQGNVAKDLNTFLTEVKKVPGVIQASSSDGTIILPTFTPRPGVYWDGKNTDDKVRFYQLGVNYDALQTFGVKMASGRYFSKEFADNDAIVINESAVRAMGLQNPVGRKITVWDKERTIVGVAKDFHFNSLHEAISPFIFRLEDPKYTMLCLIRIAGHNRKQTIEAIQQFYKEFNPGMYFDHKFLDDDYQAQYASEGIIITLSKYFAALAILISCLGLLGLTAFAAEQRLKEIGIRRTLGASRRAIVYLLSVDFTRIVAVSIVIGLPVSYVVASKWLNGFAYRIQLTPLYFIAAAGVTFFIAALTIGIQTAKASGVNPVKTLKAT
jgi:hypothetical protein